MKIDKKELNLDAEGAQSTQLCGLNRRRGVFSHPAMRGGKQAAAGALHGATTIAAADANRMAKGRRRLRSRVSDC
ncbi:hypothetical protein [Paraburkholderia aromaticivorans]|uniref:Uncharacterized protein n=1 Tax=Paraburkholderia aromaticivorans TaxID=2026199 RepID=A0A248VDH7_9BURK|nr:hypothetical protein [Paraburkholderia aromaticivorans]ASV97036.1 hypothetical protein CJU94_01915 [Paraburkholderia aromaticivorans]